jgi:hypothetical protein
MNPRKPSWGSLAREIRGKAIPPPNYPGHAHFYERAFSRRNFLATAAGAAGLALAPEIALPTLALAESHKPGLFCSPSPTPIPGGTQLLGEGTELFHVFLPAANTEPSTIGNFKGCIGWSAAHGTGTVTDDTGESSVTFSTDMRFMTGTYVSQDGKKRKGTFVFA